MKVKEVNTLIVGASAAGLSCAACMNKIGIDYEIIEKQGLVAHAWRNHYDRLHLHTNKSTSNLPYLDFSEEVPKYPSKWNVIKYLENYCDKLGINPNFNTQARNIRRTNGIWITETNNRTIGAKYLIVCTGNTNSPKKFYKQGLESFPGKVLHSCEYKNGKDFKGKKVLVVGFGNSACEIAICLHEHKATPVLSVRSPVNVIPRDILGIPVLQIGIWQSKLSPKFADQLNQPLIRLIIGDIRKYGLKKLPYGPLEQITKFHQIPLLDIGTMKLIREGAIKIHGDITQIKGDMVQFANHQEERFDAIIAAIGYQNGLNDIINLDVERSKDIKHKFSKRRLFGKDNIFFCGYHVAPTGMLREINLEAKIIAQTIKKRWQIGNSVPP